ncbi:hypothetical protein F5884DRAFT_459807 [Xylogone sp. PMI_703]|nr:hypothetical protein F5884DRAFT_459807 [Xylogone sp. PMI_703]
MHDLIWTWDLDLRCILRYRTFLSPSSFLFSSCPSLPQPLVLFVYFSPLPIHILLDLFLAFSRTSSFSLISFHLCSPLFSFYFLSVFPAFFCSSVLPFIRQGRTLPIVFLFSSSVA